MSNKPQVSIRGDTYEQIKKYCEKNGLAIAAFVDELCSNFFGNGKPKQEEQEHEANTELADDDHRKVRF